jgi:hypothetical protein
MPLLVQFPSGAKIITPAKCQVVKPSTRPMGASLTIVRCAVIGRAPGLIATVTSLQIALMCTSLVLLVGV